MEKPKFYGNIIGDNIIREAKTITELMKVFNRHYNHDKKLFNEKYLKLKNDLNLKIDF